MPRVVHFEIHADDPDRAVIFYGTVFGWHFTKWNGPQDYWLIVTGQHDAPGIDGGMMRRRGPGPAGGAAVNAFVCTIDVPNIEEYLAKITAHGGSVVVPKMPIPSVGWLAYAKDTEGNLFGIMQPDGAAS
jgi:predicted enzyme related to lactoylglutathione lyase